MLRTVKLMALVAMLFVALASSAQVTTSALSGVVTDENQQAMIGATITALHTPSGILPNDVPQPKIRSEDWIWVFLVAPLGLLLFAFFFFAIHEGNDVNFKIALLGCFKMEFFFKKKKKKD